MFWFSRRRTTKKIKRWASTNYRMLLGELLIVCKERGRKRCMQKALALSTVATICAQFCLRHCYAIRTWNVVSIPGDLSFSKRQTYVKELQKLLICA